MDGFKRTGFRSDARAARESRAFVILVQERGWRAFRKFISPAGLLPSIGAKFSFYLPAIPACCVAKVAWCHPEWLIVVRKWQWALRHQRLSDIDPPISLAGR